MTYSTAPFTVGQRVWTQNLGPEHHCTPCHPRDAKQVRVIDIEPDASMRGGWCVVVDHNQTGRAPIPRRYASSYLRAEPPPERWTYDEGQTIEVYAYGAFRTATILQHESWAPETYSVKWGVQGYAGSVGLERLRPLAPATSTVLEPYNEVKAALHDIGANPSSVGLTHAKILRDEIIRLRSQVVDMRELSVMKQAALEILGKAIGEIIPDHRASGTVIEHATSVAAALRAKVVELREQRVLAERGEEIAESERDELQSTSHRVEALLHLAEAAREDRDVWKARAEMNQEDSDRYRKERDEAQLEVQSMRDGLRALLMQPIDAKFSAPKCETTGEPLTRCADKHCARCAP